MLRHSSSIQSVLVYATFFTISLMIHMVVVWPQPSQGAGSQGAGSQGAGSQGAESTAPVASQQRAEDRPAEGTRTGAARSAQGTTEVLK